LAVPRDRAGLFEPRLFPRRQRRACDLDQMITSLYADGMTVRDIQHHLARMPAGAPMAHPRLA
jgi:putative transposase